MLLVGNHSGGNLTPDTTSSRSPSAPTSASSAPSTSSPTTSCSRCPGCRFLRKYGTVAASHGERAQGARRPAPRCSSTPAATTRSTARAGSATGSTSAAARASSGSRSTQDVPIVPGRRDRRPGDRAVPLARRAARQGACGLDQLFRLKVLPISLALPWGLNVGDMLGHLPLPAKITVEALPPIDLRERVRRRARRRRGLRPRRAR